MHPEEFKLLDEIEDDHWWFVGKRHLLTSLLQRHAQEGALLDLGCGTRSGRRAGITCKTAPKDQRRGHKAGAQKQPQTSEVGWKTNAHSIT